MNSQNRMPFGAQEVRTFRLSREAGLTCSVTEALVPVLQLSAALTPRRISSATQFGEFTPVTLLSEMTAFLSSHQVVGVAQAINKKSGNGGTFTEKDEKVPNETCVWCDVCPGRCVLFSAQVANVPETGPPPCLSSPAPCFYPAAAPSSLPLELRTSYI